MVSPCAVALCFTTLVVSLASTTAQSLPSPWVTGIATNYGGAQDGMDPSSPSFGTLDGSCGYGLLSTTVYPYWSVGALSTSNSFSLAGPSTGCGQCFEIECLNSGGQFAGRCGSAQSITITITDSCPECEADHMDLQALTFNKIAPMSIGRIDIQYRRVDCTPPLPVSIAIDNNVGVGGWLRLVVEKTAGFGGITAVAIRGGGGAWGPMNNKFGSAWEVGNTPGLPWDFQFTSDAGQTIVAQSLVSSGGVIGSIPTGVQFSLSGSTGDTAVAYDTSAAASSTATNGTAPADGAAPTAAAPATPPTVATNMAGGCPCADVQPTASITCEQQKAYGKCQDGWMTAGNFCQRTCEACPPACNGATANAPPPRANTTAPPANTPPAATNTTAPPANTPPAATNTTAAAPPPDEDAGAGATPGSVQTQSIEAPTPPAPSPPACVDNPPASGGNCWDLVANNGCYNSALLPVGTCDKSCWRC